MSNRRALSQATKESKKPKSVAKPKDIDYNSQMGYRDDSPFRNKKSIDISTPTGTIDMSQTGIPLMANGKYLPPYSGVHQFDTDIVKETPLTEERKGGSTVDRPYGKKNLKSKKYSRSLEATNILFTVNELFQKPKSRKRKVYDPNAKYYEEGGFVEADLTEEEIEALINQGYDIEVEDDNFQKGGTKKKSMTMMEQFNFAKEALKPVVAAGSKAYDSWIKEQTAISNKEKAKAATAKSLLPSGLQTLTVDYKKPFKSVTDLVNSPSGYDKLSESQKKKLKEKENAAVANATVNPKGMAYAPLTLSPEQEEFIRNQVRSESNLYNAKFEKDKAEAEALRSTVNPVAALTNKNDTYKYHKSDQQKASEILDHELNKAVESGAAYAKYKKKFDSEDNDKDLFTLTKEEALKKISKGEDYNKVIRDIYSEKEKQDYAKVKKEFDESSLLSKIGSVSRAVAADPINTIEEAIWDQDFMPGREKILRDTENPLNQFYRDRTGYDQSEYNNAFNYLNPFSSAAESTVELSKGNYGKAAGQFGEGLAKGVALAALPEIMTGLGSATVPGAGIIGLPGLTWNGALGVAGAAHGVSKLGETGDKVYTAFRSGDKNDWREATNSVLQRGLDFAGLSELKGASVAKEAGALSEASAAKKLGSKLMDDDALTMGSYNEPKTLSELEDIIYEGRPFGKSLNEPLSDLAKERELSDVIYQDIIAQAKEKYKGTGFKGEIGDDPAAVSYMQAEIANKRNEIIAGLNTPEGEKRALNYIKKNKLGADTEDLRPWENKLKEIEPVFKNGPDEELIKLGDNAKMRKYFQELEDQYGSKPWIDELKQMTKDPEKIRNSVMVQDHIVSGNLTKAQRNAKVFKPITIDEYKRNISNITPIDESRILTAKKDLDEASKTFHELNDIIARRIQNGDLKMDPRYINDINTPEFWSMATEDQGKFDDAYRLFKQAKDNYYGAYQRSSYYSPSNAFYTESGSAAAGNAENSIFMGTDYLPESKEAAAIISHEFGHHNPTRGGYKNNIKSFYNTSVDEALKNLTLYDKVPEHLQYRIAMQEAYPRRFTPQTLEDLSSGAGRTGPFGGDGYGLRRANSYFDSAADYFRTGSDENERITFLSEVKAAMKHDGIIKDGHEKISSKVLKQYWDNYVNKLGRSDEYKLRLLDIAPPTEANIKLLTREINKLPFKKAGGSIELELSDSEMRAYAQKGYVVEELPKEELIQAPKAQFKIDPNLDRDAVRGQKIAEYNPTKASYKGFDRPQGNFIPSEDISDELLSQAKASGYYPTKTASGDYELFSNKDISDLIYKKGISSQELSEKFNLGDSKDLQKHFEPVYNDAAGMHAKRNKDKIDSLIKTGMTKDQAIASLVKQGEGDVQGLNSIYGSYTDAAYQKQKAEADALNATKTISTLTPYQKEMFAKINAGQNDADAAVNTAFDNTDWSKSLTPSETTNKTAGAVYNPLTGTSEFKTSAYDKAEEAEYNVGVADKNRDLTNRKAELAKELLNNKELNEGQKQFYLNSPDAFDDLMKRHDEWKKSSTVGQSYTTASGQSVPQVGKNLNFDFNPDDKPGWSSTTKESAPSDRVDMLDKEWIQGTLGALALPGAYQGVNTLLKAAPAAAPWLNIGNALTGLGLYDAGTKYAPKVAKGIYEGATSDEGFTGERLADIGYNTWKAGKELLPFTKVGKLANIKKAKDVLSLADNSYKSATTDQALIGSDPISTLKNIKYIGSVAGLKKEGGAITLNLSDAEMKEYADKGYIVEVVDEMQEGGTPSETWVQYTGTPWSEAKTKGLTDGSAESNLKLQQKLLSGEMGKPKTTQAPQAPQASSGYDDMVVSMVKQGKTLDDLVAERVGTKEGLLYKFPALFANQKPKTAAAVKPSATGGKGTTLMQQYGALKQMLAPGLNKVINAGSKAYSSWIDEQSKLAKKEEAKKIEIAKSKSKVNTNKKQQLSANETTRLIGNYIKNLGLPFDTETVKEVAPSALKAGRNYINQLEKNALQKYLPEKSKTNVQKITQAQAKADLSFEQDLRKRLTKSAETPWKPTVSSAITPANNAASFNMESLSKNKALPKTKEYPNINNGVNIGLRDFGDTQIGKGMQELYKSIPKNKEEFLETTPGHIIGKAVFDWNKMEDPLISPFGPADLSEDEVMQLQRKLDKEGVIDTPDNLLKSDKIKQKKIVVKPKPDKFTEVLGEVDDSYAPGNPLMSYRSQWDNSEGFRYLATPVYKDRKDQDEYKNVIGVGHFLLDASATRSKPYSHEYNKAFIKKAIDNNDWVPVFKNEDGDYVRLQYKKANELTKADKVISPLRQMKFGQIDFDKTQVPKGFQSTVKEVMTKDGKGTYLLFKNKDGYSRCSGGSVVFIFKDKYDNTIIRDFAGTLNQIKEEGKSIAKQYSIAPEELTLGYHDVGSFSAKPKASKDGVLKAKQWSSYNTEGMTGGALLIPKQ